MSRLEDTERDALNKPERDEAQHESALDALHDIADKAREKVGDAADTVKDRLGDVTNKTRERLGGIASAAKERVEDAADATKEHVGAVADKAKEGALIGGAWAAAFNPFAAPVNAPHLEQPLAPAAQVEVLKEHQEHPAWWQEIAGHQNERDEKFDEVRKLLEEREKTSKEIEHSNPIETVQIDKPDKKQR